MGLIQKRIRSLHSLPTPSQRATLKYFYVVVILMGGAHKFHWAS